MELLISTLNELHLVPFRRVQKGSWLSTTKRSAMAAMEFLLFVVLIPFSSLDWQACAIVKQHYIIVAIPSDSGSASFLSSPRNHPITLATHSEKWIYHDLPRITHFSYLAIVGHCCLKIDPTKITKTSLITWKCRSLSSSALLNILPFTILSNDLSERVSKSIYSRIMSAISRSRRGP